MVSNHNNVSIFWKKSISSILNMSIFWQNRICQNLHFGQKLHFWHSVLLHCHRHWSSWYGVGMQYLNWGFRFHFLTSRGKSFFSRRTQCINDLLPISPWQTCQALFFLSFSFPWDEKTKKLSRSQQASEWLEYKKVRITAFALCYK